jgi:hypothetical protein
VSDCRGTDLDECKEEDGLVALEGLLPPVPVARHHVGLQALGRLAAEPVRVRPHQLDIRYRGRPVLGQRTVVHQLLA